MRSVRLFSWLLLVSLLFSVTVSALETDLERFAPIVDYTPAADRADYVGDEYIDESGSSVYGLSGNQTMTAVHYLYAWDGSMYSKVTSMSAGFNYGGVVNIPDRAFTIDTTNNAQGLMRDYVVFHANGNVMFFKGESLWVEIPNVSVYNGNFGALSSTSKVRNIEVQLTDTNDTVHRLTDVNVQYKFIGDGSSATALSFIVDIPYLEFDVHRFSLLFDTSLDDFTQYSTTRYIGTNGVIVADTAEGEEPEQDNTGFFAGMFDDIFGWLQDIRDNIASVFSGISSGFTNLQNKLTSVVTSITNKIQSVANSIMEDITALPRQIRASIETGMERMFVPDEEAMSAMKEDWDGLLSDRFGAVYECAMMVEDLGGSIHNASAQGQIEFPTTTLEFGDAEFNFGGLEVDVIPDGFEWLATTVRGVISIVCTLAFVNAMKRRFAEVLGGAN